MGRAWTKPLDAELEFYVIRATNFAPKGPSFVSYYIGPFEVFGRKELATIFRDFEAATRHASTFTSANGSISCAPRTCARELFDVVPLNSKTLMPIGAN